MTTAYLLDPLAPPDAPRWRAIDDHYGRYLVPKPTPRVDYALMGRWAPCTLEHVECTRGTYASQLLDWHGQIYAADQGHALTCLLAGEAVILFFVEMAGLGSP